MKIGPIDIHQKVLIVAEVGNNHEGSFSLAEEMVELSAAAGADAVKFQTFIPELYVSIREQKRMEQLRRFQLSYEQFEKLSNLATKQGLIFLSTPFDIESARFLNQFVPAFKIASGDNNFFPLLHEVSLTGKPLIISAGLTSLEEIRATKQFVHSIWKQKQISGKLSFLHCVVSYPTPPEYAQLHSLESLKSLGVPVGYSDHTLGIRAAVASVAMGARIVEKHFTKSKTYSDFRDHQLSADPEDFRAMVNEIREVEILLGSKTPKEISPVERPLIPMVRRSIVAKKDLKSGHTITWEDLTWVRPGHGLAPGNEEELLNRSLTRNIDKGEVILPTDLQSKENHHAQYSKA